MLRPNHYRRAVVIALVVISIAGIASASAVALSDSSSAKRERAATQGTATRSAARQAAKAAARQAAITSKVRALAHSASLAADARAKLLRTKSRRSFAGVAPDPLALQIIRDEAHRWALLNNEANPTGAVVFTTTMKDIAFAVDGTIQVFDANEPVYAVLFHGKFVETALPAAQSDTPLTANAMVLVYDAQTMFLRELAFVADAFSPKGVGTSLSVSLAP